MLRAVRFATVLDYKIDNQTWAALVANTVSINEISAERIREELVRMFLSPNRTRGWDLLDSSGLMRAILPEIDAMKGCAQPEQFHPEGDVFEHGLGSGLDVVSVFNLMHHLAPEKVLELMRLARAALRPGGCLVIGDTERPEPGADVSQVGALTGLAYYVASHARTYTLAEYSGWLREAGFSDVEVHRSDPSPWRVVIVASAPG